MTSNISDDADFLLSLVPFLDAHHVRTDRIEVIANRLRIMPTEEKLADRIIELEEALHPFARMTAMDDRLAGLSPDTMRAAIAVARSAMQSTLLKEGG